MTANSKQWRSHVSVPPAPPTQEQLKFSMKDWAARRAAKGKPLTAIGAVKLGRRGGLG